MNKLFIFDFDGVLADSFEYVFEINRQAVALVNSSLTKDQYIKLFYGPFHKNLLLLLNLDSKNEKIFLNYKKQIYPNIYKKTKLFDFVKKTINALYQKDIILAIISSAREESVVDKLKEYNLYKKFNFIAGMNKNGKIKNIQTCVKMCNVIKKQTFFITDTVGDIRDAKTIGIKTVGVTWGFHKTKELQLENPDYLISEPRHLLSLV